MLQRNNGTMNEPISSRPLRTERELRGSLISRYLPIPVVPQKNSTYGVVS